MTWDPKQLVGVINSNRERTLAVSKIVDANPRQLGILPKLIQDPSAATKPEEKNAIQVNRGILENMHNQIQLNRRNSKNIIELFPDIELAIQILVSYILSPKKMTDTQLNFRLRKGFEAAPALSAALLECVKEYISEEHELEDKLADILREALFNTGSYCMVVIPEASVDQVINADIIASYSTENFQAHVERTINSLSTPIFLNTQFKKHDLLDGDKLDAKNFVQHLASETFVRMTDNTKILHFGKFRDEISSKIVATAMRKGTVATEDASSKIGYMDLFRERRQGTTSIGNVEVLKDRDETRRKSIGKPMVTRFPSASVMPGIVPGNPQEHLFFLVLLDESGKPFNVESIDSRGTNINNFSSMVSADSNNSTPIQKAYNNLIQNSSKSSVDVNSLFDMYKEIMERQIYQSVKGTLHGSNFEIADRDDIFFLMFSRALAGERTNILLVPKSQMTYFAFNYNEYGVGISLLEKLTILSGLRAQLLFSSVMAQSKQAIDVTKVNIQLDPTDQDPESTIAQIQDGVLKLRQNFFPLGINSPVDLVNWIQRAGLQFTYSNNPLLPDVKIDFENANLTHTVPDGALEENLRKWTIQALGLSPEVIDSGFSPEFATTVVNNNVLLSKRVAIYQKALNRHTSNFVSQVLYNDQDIRATLTKILTEKAADLEASLTEAQKTAYAANKESFIESYLDELSQAVLVELPKPENTNLTSLAAEFEVYKNGLETVVDSVLSTEIFTEDLTGDITNHIDSIKSVFKHHLLRAWCADNNYYPEAMALSGTSTEEVDAIIEVITKHLTTTMRSSSSLLTVMKKYKEAAAADLQKALGTKAGENSFTDSSGGGSSGGDGGAPDGGGGGGDDGLGDFSLDGGTGDDFLAL